MLPGVTRSVIAGAVLVLAGLAGCKGDERATTPVTNTVQPAGNAIPAGWLTIQPTEERLRCANYSHDEWRIAIDHGAVQIAKATSREPDTGPSLPFALPKLQEPRGRRHVLPFGGGYLVGFDAGEWGGALYWFASDGSGQQKLGAENVRGLIALGPEAALSIEGLAHLGISEGALRWVERKGGALDATAVTKLPDAPEAFAQAGDDLYVLTTSSLVRIGRDRRVAVIQPVKTPGLYPDSMGIDASGALWVGMRQLVLRLTPERGRFSETWFARKECRRVEQADLECLCHSG
jgi:hypothetical protein